MILKWLSFIVSLCFTYVKMSEDDVNSFLDDVGLGKSKGGGENFHFSIFSSVYQNTVLKPPSGF